MLHTEWKYHLEKYRSPASRHQCPACGDKKSFALYVDGNGVMIDEAVGRCNHESSCGYHLTPHDYFVAHPNLAPWANKEATDYHPSYGRAPTKPKVKKICTIPMELVTRSRSDNSQLVRYLYSIAPDTGQLKSVLNRYHIGATKSGATIFWQIDKQQKCRTGKVIGYKPNGHRDKTAGCDWIHSIMKRQSSLPQDWELTQCLFGEHLLTENVNRNKLVAIVESEKTAIICAAQFPQILWLATGGKSQLSNDKMRVLTGRSVVFFPDVDGYDEWTERVRRFTFLASKQVSDILQRKATAADREAKIDIADLILREWTEAKLREADTPLAREMRKLEAMIERNPAIQLLIDKLDLELVVPDA